MIVCNDDQWVQEVDLQVGFGQQASGKIHQKSVNVLSHLISLNEVEVLPVNSVAVLKVPTLLLTPGTQLFLTEGKLLVYFSNKQTYR